MSPRPCVYTLRRRAPNRRPRRFPEALVFVSSSPCFSTQALTWNRRRNLQDEHPLLSNRGRDELTAALLLAASAALFILVAAESVTGPVQRLDDSFLRLMATHRTPVFTAIAMVLNVLGSSVVTLPVRIGVAAYLGFTRRWWHFTAFLLAMVVSEACIGTLKIIYGRPRPPGSLVTTGGASFPSGHAVAASVTAVALVLALFPAGPHRFAWGAAAAVFALAMAVSRAYLAAHWLSDAVAGTLLGTLIALLSALLVQRVRDLREREMADTPDPPAPSTLLPASG